MSRQAAARIPHVPPETARNPPSAARDPGRRIERLLSPGVARRLAAGDLFHQPQDDRGLAEIFAARADLSRRPSGPSPAADDRAERRATCRCFAGSLSIRPMAKAGRCTPSRSPTSLAPTRASSAPAILQSYLFRAERLVVDTGLHHKRWTREQAIDHMVAATGFPRPRVQREIERYCASPGQACSYKIGHIAWVRRARKARARSATREGDAFFERCSSLARTWPATFGHLATSSQRSSAASFSARLASIAWSARRTARDPGVEVGIGSAASSPRSRLRAARSARQQVVVALVLVGELPARDRGGGPALRRGLASGASPWRGARRASAAPNPHSRRRRCRPCPSRRGPSVTVTVRSRKSRSWLTISTVPS